LSAVAPLMSWISFRVGLACIVITISAVVGYLFGAPTEATLQGVLVGSLVGLSLFAVVDTIRAHRLLRWLRARREEPPPRDAGLWGEIGYRVEGLILSGMREAALEQTRLAQFRSAIEASPNGVLMLDRNDQIEWLNSVAADHFGLDPTRDLRQRITNLVRAPAFVDYMQEGAWGAPVKVPRPHGQGSLSILIRPYGEGQKLILSSDVTEIERTDGMRRDFVANVSHEIRTPLTVLSGFIETMTDLPLTEVERRRVLSLMAQQTTRMQALVSDLLTLASLEGSPRPPVDVWVSLDKLLAEVRSDAAALSAGRHRISTEGDPAVQIAGNESELASAIANLVNNAVRYTPDGGSIAIAWRLLANGAGELSVTDDGIGIDRAHLPRLTERFYRGDASRSRDTGGTGLGLAIVKHVVQRHGGELSIQSEPGMGATFRLAFPAARIRFLEPARDPRRAEAVTQA
jgi:two-component system phosphate regulon sensor histidine kinase PhoR